MDELSEINANHTKASGDQHQFLAFLDGLGAPPDVELGKEVGAVGFDGIDGDEQLIGDLLVAHAHGHEFKDFEFPFTDAEFLEPRWVELEIGDGNWNLNGFFPGELEAGPGADGGENKSENTGVKFYRKVADEITVLEELENEDQGCQGDAVEEYCFSHRAKIGCGEAWSKEVHFYPTLNRLPLQLTT